MENGHRRREFLALGSAAVGLGPYARRFGGPDAPLCPPTNDDSSLDTDQSSMDPVDVRGAMYLPARAFNFYQMWRDYDRAEIERDLGYASRVNLNAIRTWVSFAFWERRPKAHQRRVDHFLTAAAERDISVLFSLFEGNGVWPTDEHLENRNPFTAVGVRSPGWDVLGERTEWDRTRRFVRWFAERYGDDDRLLAIELMNEPHWNPVAEPFAREMFDTLARNRGKVPLTVGSTSMVNNATYIDWGVDALQFHYNFPRSAERYRQLLGRMATIADRWDGPTWLTEWQRVRTPPFSACPPNDDHTYPDYASLAPVVHESGFGNFFWSLMLKPAYLPPMRGNGVLNGLFHEDGAVWSLDDARAIKAMSGDTSVEGLEERQEWPAWAAKVKARACRPGSGGGSERDASGLSDSSGSSSSGSSSG